MIFDGDFFIEGRIIIHIDNVSNICVEKNCWMTSRENDVFLPLKCSWFSEIVLPPFVGEIQLYFPLSMSIVQV